MMFAYFVYYLTSAVHMMGTTNAKYKINTTNINVHIHTSVIVPLQWQMYKMLQDIIAVGHIVEFFKSNILGFSFNPKG